jgi:hypothetical protein
MRPILVLALAACSSAAPQWEKPGAGASAVDEAMQDCRVQASLSPQQHKGAPTPRAGGTPAIDRIEDRQSREAQQFQGCMQGRGFSIRR